MASGYQAVATSRGPDLLEGDQSPRTPYAAVAYHIPGRLGKERKLLHVVLGVMLGAGLVLMALGLMAPTPAKGKARVRTAENNIGHPKHVLILDCGSSGTRIYAYSWQAPGSTSPQALPLLRLIPPSAAASKVPRKLAKGLYQRVETQPGLHTFVDNDKGLEAQALGPLLEWARAVVPSGERKSTPLLLLGTGGLRRLPQSQRENLLARARTLLAGSGFAFEPSWARVISGTDEAVYGWVALNYGHGTLGSIAGAEVSGGTRHGIRAQHGADGGGASARMDIRRGSSSGGSSSSGGGGGVGSSSSRADAPTDTHSTIGALDLGGASLEVAFEPQDVPPADTTGEQWQHGLTNLTLAGTTRWLHTHAFHGYGLNEAFDRSVTLLLADTRRDRGHQQQQQEQQQQQQQQHQRLTDERGHQVPGNGAADNASSATEPAPLVASTPADTSNLGSLARSGSSSGGSSPSVTAAPAWDEAAPQARLAIVAGAHLSQAEALAAAAGLRGAVGPVPPSKTAASGVRRQLLVYAAAGETSLSQLHQAVAPLDSTMTVDFGSADPAWRAAAERISVQGHRWSHQSEPLLQGPRRRLGGNQQQQHQQQRILDQQGASSPQDPAPAPQSLPHLQHPCLHDGYSARYSRIMRQGHPPDPPAVQLTGAQDFQKCVALARRLVNASIPCQSEGKAWPSSSCVLGSLQPKMPGSFTAVTGFYVVSTFLRLQHGAPATDLLPAAKRLCSMPWSRVSAELGDQVNVERYCLWGPYVALLLQDGLRLTNHSHLAFGSGDVAWPLGAALVEAGKIPGFIPQALAAVQHRHQDQKHKQHKQHWRPQQGQHNTKRLPQDEAPAAEWYSGIRAWHVLLLTFSLVSALWACTAGRQRPVWRRVPSVSVLPTYVLSSGKAYPGASARANWE